MGFPTGRPVSEYIDGPPVNNNQRNKWSTCTCTGIHVGSRTAFTELQLEFEYVRTDSCEYMSILSNC